MSKISASLFRHWRKSRSARPDIWIRHGPKPSALSKYSAAFMGWTRGNAPCDTEDKGTMGEMALFMFMLPVSCAGMVTLRGGGGRYTPRKKAAVSFFRNASKKPFARPPISTASQAKYKGDAYPQDRHLLRDRGPGQCSSLELGRGHLCAILDD